MSVRPVNNASVLRNIFLVLFIASTLLALALAINFSNGIFPAPTNTEIPVVVTQNPAFTPTPAGTETVTEEPDTQPTPDNTNFVTFAGTLITSATSLIGFITTTVITWRKEKRESAIADVERKKLETELAKSRLELQNLKKSKSATTNKKKSRK